MDDAKPRDDARPEWVAPALTRMCAGDAENGFPSPDPDHHFPFS